MDKKKLPLSLEEKAYQKILELEGYSPDVYKDIKGISTIGGGLNLEAPETRALFKSLGYDPDAVKEGRVQVPAEDLRFIKQQSVDKSIREVKRKFEGLDLDDNQILALASLHFNSPSLIGPNLTKYITEGDRAQAAKEIYLRSNREKSPGITKRRLKEAETFYGKPLSNIPTSPDEKAEVFGLLNQMKDSAEKSQLLNQYAHFNPDKIDVPFYKVRRSLASQTSPAPIPDAPPVMNVIPEIEQINPAELIPIEQNNTILDRFNLLKNLRK